MGLDFRIELLHAPAFRVAFSSLSRPSSEHDASHHLHLGDPADLPKSLQCARTRRHTVREAWPANVEEIRSSTETQVARSGYVLTGVLATYTATYTPTNSGRSRRVG